MKGTQPIREGQILSGSFFNAPMRVESVRAGGPDTSVAGLVGTRSERFRKVTLTPDDLESPTVLDATYTVDGDGRLLPLGPQAYSLGIAYEFDPYFGLSISRVDPLPHQLEAVHDYLLELARVRFPLADDAGAGKTIMAGLLIRELGMRGLAERILIVCPANLSFQWQRELKEKFDEKFLVFKGHDIRDQFGVNQWLEQNRIITSLDLAKREEIFRGRRQVHWDLVIVDEAHRMSAADETHKSLRYKLGELLRDISDHMILLTATPHKGDPVDFSLFLQLLDADAYAHVTSIRGAMERRRAPFCLRRTKEAMVYFPERRLASSTYAMRRSLDNRAKRLEEGLKRARELARQAPPDLADPEELEEMLEAIILAGNAHQVREEAEELRKPATQARVVEDSGSEAKLSKLKELLQQEGFFDHPEQRLLIFTEFKDTLEYLLDRFRSWGFRVGCIHGGMKPGSRDEPGTRLHAEQQFREGRVLQGLLDKLQEIRDALDDDAVFNVVGEVLPAAHVERVLRDYCAGRLGDADLEERLLRNVDEQQFRAIRRNALEGLASKKLNLEMVIERRARAQERRVVPETIARFLKEAAETNNLEWVTPGRPLFEAIRRHTHMRALDVFGKGACFYSLQHDEPVRIDFYRARVVDGLGQVIHERLFGVEISQDEEPRLREPSVLGDFTPVERTESLPPVAMLPEADAWLHETALAPFLDETRRERLAEVERVSAHVEFSLTELLQRADEEIGRAASDVERGVPGAEGRLARAESRHGELLRHRQRRRADLEQQRAFSLQAVERIASAVVLPHPERETPEVRRLRPNLETEAAAMRVVMEYERPRGRKVYGVHEKNLGYDITSLDLGSGELRLIEVKGLAGVTGTILLTPNERRVAEDRRDCYCLYVVTGCGTKPRLEEPIKDPARFDWREVTKVAHYYLSVDAMAQPIRVRESPASCRRSDNA